MENTSSYPVRVAYFTVAVLAVAGILYQVFLVGLSLLAGQPSWDAHVGFGHMIGVFPLLLLLIAYFGRLPGGEKRWNWLFFGVYIVQAELFAVIRGAVPLLAALHPVLAMVVFATSAVVAWRGYSLLRLPSEARQESDRAAI